MFRKSCSYIVAKKKVVFYLLEWEKCYAFGWTWFGYKGNSRNGLAVVIKEERIVSWVLLGK